MRRFRQDTLLVVVEIAIFCVVLAVLSLDEFFDIPYLYFGSSPEPVRWGEYLTEAIAIAIVGVISVGITLLLQRRIRRIEAFLRVCGWCKKVRVDDKWIPFEQYISQTYSLESSHGICDECRIRLTEEARLKHGRGAGRGEATERKH